MLYFNLDAFHSQNEHKTALQQFLRHANMQMDAMNAKQLVIDTFKIGIYIFF